MRIISDDLYANLIKILAADEKVKLFQQLLLSKKIEAEEKPAENEAEKNGI